MSSLISNICSLLITIYVAATSCVLATDEANEFIPPLSRVTGSEAERLKTDATNMRVAVNVGDVSAVRQILNTGPSSKTDKYAQMLEFSSSGPLWCAAADGHADIVNELLDAGASAKEEMFDSNAIEIAIYHRRLPVLRMLLDRCTHISPVEINNLLVQAAYWGYFSAVTELLSRGADVNGANKGYRNSPTALHAAVNLDMHREICEIKERTEIVSVLLSAGSFIDSRDQFGNSPLLIAAYCRYYTIIPLLLEWGANPFIEFDKGQTLFSILCTQQQKCETSKELACINKVLNILIKKIKWDKRKQALFLAYDADRNVFSTLPDEIIRFTCGYL